MESETIANLVSELNMTRLALGQVICNYEREFDNLSLQRVAKNWLAKSPQLSRKEWIAGAEALIHGFRVLPSKSATEAISILAPPQQKYDENVGIYRGIYPRKGRGKNAETFRRGVEIIEDGFGVQLIDETCAQNQNPRCDKGGMLTDSSKSSTWKSKLAGSLKWLINP